MEVLILKKQKRKMKLWKKILLGLIVVLLAVAAYILYLFQFKEYDTEDSEVTEITRETYKIELPDGSVIELDENNNIVETAGNGSTDADSSNDTSDDGTSSESNGGSTGDTGTSNNGSTNGNASGSNGSGNEDGTSSGGSGSKPNNGNNSGSNATVATIKAKYEPVMSELQGQANGRIDALVGRAYSEYQGKKASGESINYAYFYNKYTSAAAELEARTDKVFYQVIAVIEKELVANGYGKSHAQSFVSQYEAEKEARRSSLLDRAMSQ